MADPERATPSRTPRRDDTNDPRRARQRALKILFQADVRGVDPTVTLERVSADPAARAMLDLAEELADGRQLLGPESDAGEPPVVKVEAIDGFTRTLVAGVAEHRTQIDALIGSYARRWQVARMPVVDRNVLRLATFELMHEPTSAAVVINEAINLAKSLSTDDSGRYVNGVLESVRKHLERDRAAGVVGTDADADEEVREGPAEVAVVDDAVPSDGGDEHADITSG